MTLNSYIMVPVGSKSHPILSNNREDNGPTELADVMLHLLRTSSATNPENCDWLSESWLRKLIEIAFFASLAPEEGRYPRCSLFWSVYPHEWFDTAEFLPDRSIDVETLRRFAPICQTRGSAIRVALRGNDLRIVGLTATRFEGLDMYPGKPGFVHGGRELNVQVHILAPGHIRVADGEAEFELRAGKIRQCTDLRVLPCVKKLTKEFAEKVGIDVITKLKLTEEECKLFGGLRSCLAYETILEWILRPILDLGHGGAVIVVPNRNISWLSSALQSFSEVSALTLTERAVDHLAACVECHRPVDGSPDLNLRLMKSIQTRGRLINAARTIGEFASVDGCVVIDRQLSVISFGAKINTTRELATKSRIQYVNAKDKTVIDLDDLEKLGGTRLRSALWLCKTNPNVIAFVVSQDQNLKVLWSEDTTAYAFGPIAMETIR